MSWTARRFLAFPFRVTAYALCFVAMVVVAAVMLGAGAFILIADAICDPTEEPLG